MGVAATLPEFSCRSGLHEHVFIENDLVFNENATLYCIYISFSYRFRIVFMFFSLETVFKSHRFQSFSCRCKVKMQRKAFFSDENDLKTYSCRQGLKIL